MTSSRPIFATLVLAGMMCLAIGAHAAQRDATVSGSGLSIDTPCARSVDIRLDPSLHGAATVHATADHQEELDRLVFETRETARIRHKEEDCWRPEDASSFEPTLDLVVLVPAGFNITIDESAAGRYAIGPVGGKLTLDLSGAASVKAASAAGLTVDMSGSGAVEATRVSGDATIELSGHGRVTIADAAIPSLNVELSGTGGVTIGGGTIGSARFEVSGAGEIGVGGETKDASVDLSGVGSVHFAKLTGDLHKDVSGMGSVSAGN